MCLDHERVEVTRIPKSLCESENLIGCVRAATEVFVLTFASTSVFGLAPIMLSREWKIAE